MLSSLSVDTASILHVKTVESCLQKLWNISVLPVIVLITHKIPSFVSAIINNVLPECYLFRCSDNRNIFVVIQGLQFPAPAQQSIMLV